MFSASVFVAKDINWPKNGPVPGRGWCGNALSGEVRNKGRGCHHTCALVRRAKRNASGPCQISAPRAVGAR